MSDEMKPGDVVKVKSGGDPMTVAWVEQGRAFCQWMSKDGERKEGGFFVAVLEKATSGSKVL